MATSDVAICNLALSAIGDEAITSLTDNSNRARLCKTFYPHSREKMLDLIKPNFAIHWQQLAQLATAPPSGFAYAYQLPSDCIRCLNIGTTAGPWKRFGRTIVTDEATVTLQYVRLVTDPVQFTPKFTEALVAELAAKLAWPITKLRSAAEDALLVYKDAVEEAQAAEGQEGDPDVIECTTLLDVR